MLSKYRWDKKIFVENMLTMIVIVLFVVGFSKAVIWGFEQEAKINSNMIQEYLQK